MKLIFYGELINAEHHLELINIDIFNELRTFRKNCSEKRLKLEEADLDTIRAIYNKVLTFETRGYSLKNIASIAQNNTETKVYDQTLWTIVYDSPEDEEMFDLSFTLLKRNVVNEHQILVLTPKISMTKYADYVEIVPQTLLGAIRAEKIVGEEFVYMKENQMFLKPFDLNFLFNSFRQQLAPNADFLKELGVKKYPYIWDVGKPQVINKKQFSITLTEDMKTNLLTTYFNLIGAEPKYNERFNVLTLDRALCCSNKAKIGRMNFAEIKGTEALNSFKNWLNAFQSK